MSRKPPEFGSNADNIVAQPTAEMVRIRELRKATLALVEQMTRDGWIGSDSPIYGDLDAAFLEFWREYCRLYARIEGEDARDKMFGNAHYTIGYTGIMNYGNLNIGDCIKNDKGVFYKVTYKTHNSITFTKRNSYAVMPVSFRDTESPLTYLGKDLW